jgi:pimeloyl-ACP methyl ester carboxylesterase
MKRHTPSVLTLLALLTLTLTQPFTADAGTAARAPVRPTSDKASSLFGPAQGRNELRTTAGPTLLPAQDCRASSEQRRPMVIIGGWSNVPENFLDTAVVNGLARRLFVTTENSAGSFIVSTPDGQSGLTNVLLTRHRDPYGDIDQNATFEAAQIVRFMDLLNAECCCAGTDFDLVGFSMGGLVARSIVLKFGAALGRYRVANLVTMGTPNHGVNPIVAGVGTLWYSAQGQSGTATAQMMPFSPFLVDLNGRQIPSSIKVTTIAGSALVDTVPQPLHPAGHTTVVACVHPALQHPGGDQTPETRVPCLHPECRRRVAGICVQFGPQHPDGDVVAGRWVPCTHLIRQHPDGDPVTTPCTHLPASSRVGIGSDGLVRVVSVNLRPAEAANIVAQRVLDGLWHTEGNESLARAGAPAPKPFIDGRNSPPEQALGNPPPILGTAVRSPHFFSDDRVKDILLSVTNSR